MGIEGSKKGNRNDKERGKDMRGYEWATEAMDYRRIDKLNKLTNPDTFWDDVRKLTKKITSDHSIKRWQILAEGRYRELTGKES